MYILINTDNVVSRWTEPGEQILDYKREKVIATLGRPTHTIRVTQFLEIHEEAEIYSVLDGIYENCLERLEKKNECE